jgi:hypothetical protein
MANVMKFHHSTTASLSLSCARVPGRAEHAGNAL